MKSIKQAFIRSHNIPQVFSALAVVLSIILAATIYIYSTNILNLRVPNAKLAHQLIRAVDESMSQLKTWILLGDLNARQQRKQLWSKVIPALVSEIDQQLKNIEQSVYFGEISEINRLRETITSAEVLLIALEDSQWWVDDISASNGGSPSRVIYDRDILPLFANLNSALEGLMYDDSYNPIESHELKVSLLTAHHHLSDGLRELSEAVRTGLLPHVNSFYREAKLLDDELSRFLKIANDKGSSESLLTWVVTNYKEYLRLAHKSIERRQAVDANLGVTLYQNETTLIAEELRVLLQDLIETESQLLVSGAKQVNFELMLFLMVIAFIFCVSFFIGFLTARSAANHYIQGVNALTVASQEMIEGRLQPVSVSSKFAEIQTLLVAFSQMQNAVRDREVKLTEQQKELEQLTHIVTHDMKPPIINIKGHAGIISDKIGSVSWQSESLERDINTLQAEVDESLIYINQSTARIGELVGKILTYAEWSSLKLNIELCDLNTIIANVFAINSHRLQDADIIMPAGLAIIKCDSFALKTIVSTIIDNAIQYKSPVRKLVISLTYQELNQFHRLSLTDNGIGIAPEISESIYLLSGKQSGKNFNFGIGLAGAKKLIYRIGGNIWHESNQGTCGTVFHIDVPKIDTL